VESGEGIESYIHENLFCSVFAWNPVKELKVYILALTGFWEGLRGIR